MKSVKDFGAGTRTLMSNFFVQVFGLRFGFQYSPIIHNHSPYMTRYIIYLGLVNLRLHKFYRGDKDRVSHTHPWWFITFPLSPYWEKVYHHGKHVEDRVVYAYRPHWRPRSFEHRVVSGLRQVGKHPVHGPVMQEHKRPFWTIVLASGFAKEWGFYTPSGKYIPYWEYTHVQS